MIEFNMDRRTGKTTTAIALVHGFRALGFPALYVAPTRNLADLVVRSGALASHWVVVGARGICLHPAPVYVLDEAALFERSPEVDPVQIALRRAETFKDGAVYAFY